MPATQKTDYPPIALTAPDWEGFEGTVGSLRRSNSSDAFINQMMFYHRTADWDAEKKLMVAVLEDALGSLFLVPAPPKILKYKYGRNREREREQDWAWLHAKPTEYVFDFENICTTLGFDPSWMRKMIIDEIQNRGQRKAKHRAMR